MKYFPPESDDEFDDLWLIKYEDGDAEHMDAEEVIGAVVVVVVVVDVEGRSGFLWVRLETAGYLCWWDGISSSKRTIDLERDDFNFLASDEVRWSIPITKRFGDK